MYEIVVGCVTRLLCFMVVKCGAVLLYVFIANGATLFIYFMIVNCVAILLYFRSFNRAAISLSFHMVNWLTRLVSLVIVKCYCIVALHDCHHVCCIGIASACQLHCGVVVLCDCQLC